MEHGLSRGAVAGSVWAKMKTSVPRSGVSGLAERMRGIWAKILRRDCMRVWRQGSLNSRLRLGTLNSR